ncbi:poly(A) polymerase [Roseovarius nanhaiticus]|uniref:Poly(A) polymerase n=1 Tax=Roseovarius nanhaiticus TaxID=573024 RepID=A0A1N7EIU1_9RHOB|nr:CCA tRNA nucleotidyltransferase [Roseovarius nanhaiticus]SEK73923.1 poly(A) polymerase [Roseovarius nanhaiticus]SIR87888.1 poly(A) polymerase [Roseovarius nanhaiticus]
MRIEEAWLTEAPLVTIFDAFEAAGHRVYLVGGAVRNALLGEPVGDLDLATDAVPEQMMQLAEAAGIKAIPTGIGHGTVTLVLQGTPFEITTFRQDVETDGRHATVDFTDDITRDARRRDFTMNALYVGADGTVIDPLGGLPDVMARRVRFIEDAGTRIREDYLRILRFFRFHAQYGGARGMDSDGLAAVADNLDGLDGLARERVGSEVLRLLAAPDPAPAVAAMDRVGVLTRLLPGADSRALAPLIHLEAEAGSIGPDSVRRLAALGGEDAQGHLRLSNADSARLDVLKGGLGDMTSPEVLGYLNGAEAARDILLLRAAIFEQPLDPGALAAANHGARQRFPIVAADLMPAYQGAALGARLRALEARWIASRFTLGRDDLLEESA